MTHTCNVSLFLIQKPYMTIQTIYFAALWNGVHLWREMKWAAYILDIIMWNISVANRNRMKIRRFLSFSLSYLEKFSNVIEENSVRPFIIFWIQFRHFDTEKISHAKFVYRNLVMIFSGVDWRTNRSHWKTLLEESRANHHQSPPPRRWQTE